jgi:phosphoribosylformylglycinamidine synthase
MLCVCTADNAAAVLAVCEKWEVGGTVIGQVTDTRRMRIFRGDQLVGDIPVTALVDDCPLYDLAPAPPSSSIYPAPAASLDAGDDPLLALIGSPNLTSRRPLFQQYDCIVGSRTVRRPEQADAAVLVLDNGASIGVSIDGNGRRVAADPYTGTVEAVLECAANLACVGASPLGLTNCLNFGNPEKPHIAWQLSESVRGLGDACRALGVPVVGGNVSLYNEGGEGPIYPTPVVGMVGELPDPTLAAGLGFGRSRDVIALVRVGEPSLHASELAKLRGEPLPDGLAAVDVAEVAALHEAVRGAVRSGALVSCHDVAEGGLAVALAESCLAGDVGATVEIAGGEVALYGEAPGRAFVVSGAREDVERALPSAAVIGTVGGEALEIGAGRWSLTELRGEHGRLASLFA